MPLLPLIRAVLGLFDLLAQVVLHVSQPFALQSSLQFLFVGHRICQKNERRIGQSKCKF